jgi:hypothetical protein
MSVTAFIGPRLERVTGKEPRRARVSNHRFVVGLSGTNRTSTFLLSSSFLSPSAGLQARQPVPRLRFATGGMEKHVLLLLGRPNTRPTCATSPIPLVVRLLFRGFFGRACLKWPWWHFVCNLLPRRACCHGAVAVSPKRNPLGRTPCSRAALSLFAVVSVPHPEKADRGGEDARCDFFPFLLASL